MIISREVDINVNRYGLRVVIPVVQYDSGRQIIFNIVDAELPSGCTSNIFIKKPSGKSVYNECTVSGNKVTVTLTNQSLSECGFNDSQIQVIKGEEVVTSFSFILEVKQSDADNAVISRSESTFFQGLVNKAQAVAKTCTEVADSIPDDYSQMSTKVNANANAITAINSNWVNINTASELNSKLSALPSNKTLNVLLQGAVTAVLTNNMVSSSGKGYIAKISDTSVDYSIMTGSGDFIFIGRYNFSDGKVSSVQKVPTRSEVDANTAAIDAVKTDLLGGYKLVGYTRSVVMDKAGEYIIPYPSGENFGTVYGILSATFLLGGYCLPYPPLTSSKSPSFDISQAVAFRILSTGIAIYTGGGWGADSRDIYFVLICKA